jgi:phage shock protein PspC (stress-responsive transcriptional regulator)
MSPQELENKDQQLSDEQLEGVSGGLGSRFDEAMRENLDKGVSKEEGELSDEQLQGVAGGLGSRFDQAQQENLDKGLSTDAKLSERFKHAHEQNLEG